MIFSIDFPGPLEVGTHPPNWPKTLKTSKRLHLQCPTSGNNPFFRIPPRRGILGQVHHREVGLGHLQHSFVLEDALGELDGLPHERRRLHHWRGPWRLWPALARQDDPASPPPKASPRWPGNFPFGCSCFCSVDSLLQSMRCKSMQRKRGATRLNILSLFSQHCEATRMHLPIASSHTTFGFPSGMRRCVSVALFLCWCQWRPADHRPAATSHQPRSRHWVT